MKLSQILFFSLFSSFIHSGFALDEPINFASLLSGKKFMEYEQKRTLEEWQKADKLQCIKFSSAEELYIFQNSPSVSNRQKDFFRPRVIYFDNTFSSKKASIYCEACEQIINFNSREYQCERTNSLIKLSSDTTYVVSFLQGTFKNNNQECFRMTFFCFKCNEEFNSLH